MDNLSVDELSREEVVQYMDERGYELDTETLAGIKFRLKSPNPHQDYIFVSLPIPRSVFATILRKQALRPLS